MVVQFCIDEYGASCVGCKGCHVCSFDGSSSDGDFCPMGFNGSPHFGVNIYKSFDVYQCTSVMFLCFYGSEVFSCVLYADFYCMCGIVIVFYNQFGVSFATIPFVVTLDSRYEYASSVEASCGIGFYVYSVGVFNSECSAVYGNGIGVLFRQGFGCGFQFQFVPCHVYFSVYVTVPVDGSEFVVINCSYGIVFRIGYQFQVFCKFVVSFSVIDSRFFPEFSGLFCIVVGFYNLLTYRVVKCRRFGIFSSRGFFLFDIALSVCFFK